MGSSGRITATQAERFKMSGLLRDNTEPAGDGLVRYTNGYSDERVRDEVNPSLAVTVIANFRRQALGNLVERSNIISSADLSSRLRRAEQRIDWVITQYNKLAAAAGYPELAIAEDEANEED